MNIGKDFLLGERYRLELFWSGTKYTNGGCLLQNARFAGPVLASAERILPNDGIFLDLCSQYYTVINTIYIIQLKWGNLNYNTDGTVSLYDCLLELPTEINKIEKLRVTDKLVIDTKGHEAEEHAHTLLYKAYIVNKDGQLYNFNKA